MKTQFCDHLPRSKYGPDGTDDNGNERPEAPVRHNTSDLLAWARSLKGPPWSERGWYLHVNDWRIKQGLRPLDIRELAALSRKTGYVPSYSGVDAPAFERPKVASVVDLINHVELEEPVSGEGAEEGVE